MSTIQMFTNKHKIILFTYTFLHTRYPFFDFQFWKIWSEELKQEVEHTSVVLQNPKK